VDAGLAAVSSRLGQWVESTMDDVDLFEPGSHVFTGVVRSWTGNYGELVTDSGLSVIFVIQGQPQPMIGERITIKARRYRPVHHATALTRG
jgi:hypothetical protein